MNLQLKEDRTHGSREFPYDQYYMRHIRHSFQIPVHWHEEIEIIYVEDGCLNVKIGEREYEGKAGDIFFVNARELHLMGTKDLSAQYYTILFPLAFISFQTMDELETELLGPLRNSQLLFPEYVEERELRERMLPLLKKLTVLNYHERNESIRKKEFVAQHLQTRFLLLELLECLYEADAFVRPFSSHNLEQQREILIFIQKHFAERITLHMLAEEFHLSEKYMSRYFVEKFHLPFSNYVIHLRLTEARKLLEKTEQSVTDIALQVGFSNVSYFIRAFKESYGTSPLKYRNRIK